jgi:hypothetical protein
MYQSKLRPIKWKCVGKGAKTNMSTGSEANFKGTKLYSQRSWFVSTWKVRTNCALLRTIYWDTRFIGCLWECQLVDALFSLIERFMWIQFFGLAVSNGRIYKPLMEDKWRKYYCKAKTEVCTKCTRTTPSITSHSRTKLSLNPARRKIPVTSHLIYGWVLVDLKFIWS